MNKCDTCDYFDKCDDAGQVNFCEDCRDFPDCRICTVTCEAGHFIECNNGFEEEGYCDEYDEEDDEDDAGESNA